MNSKTNPPKLFKPEHNNPIFRIEYFSDIENKDTSEYIRAPNLAKAIEIWQGYLKRFDITIPDNFRVRNVNGLKP